jgi:hypothetical protein
MESKKIEAILKEAVVNKVFREKLLKERQRALESIRMSNTEKSLLCSYSSAQLNEMIEETRLKLRKWRNFKIGISLIILIIVIALSLKAFSGKQSEPYEKYALNTLKQLAIIEKLYYETHHHYGSMEELKEDAVSAHSLKAMLKEHSPYKYEIEAGKNDFSIKALLPKPADKEKFKEYQINSQNEVTPLP